MSTKKTLTLEERIAARAAAQQVSQSELDAQAREDAEMSLPALTAMAEIGARLKADLATFAEASQRVFMPGADAGLQTIRNPDTVRNIGVILDTAMITAAATKATAETILAPAPEA